MLTELTEAATEEWRPVPGHQDRYEVSSLGRVRSWKVARYIPGEPRRPGHKVLKTWLAPNGRRHVTLGYNGGKRVVWMMSALVAETFIGPRPVGHDVCHNNGDGVDDRAENLRYDTRKGNMADTAAHGTRIQGERSHFAKVTEADVIEIRSRRAAGEKHRTIAADFGITEDASQAIVLRKSWKHVA